jgi:hypothetical protein
VIDREADLALQVDGQASVVHRGLPGDRPKGGNAHLGRGHERLEEVDAEPFADAVERLEVTVDDHGGLPNVGGLIHPAADDSTDGPVPLREGVGATRVDVSRARRRPPVGGSGTRARATPSYFALKNPGSGRV